jgi:hypothetical protein
MARKMRQVVSLNGGIFLFMEHNRAIGLRHLPLRGEAPHMYHDLLLVAQ